MPSVSKKDVADLEFGVKVGVEFVALSFVHTAQDIINLRALIKKFEKKLKLKKQAPILIIAKIEQHEAVENIDAILQVVDGIMVARGDLGLEMKAAEVPLVQKTIIAKANLLSKPVIVATQMLDSMQHNRRPTRAEVSDVANAVIDHADAVMLSNETASGEFPVLTVKTMSDIVVTTEASPFDDVAMPVSSKESAPSAITELSRALSFEVGSKLIVADSVSGETARMIAGDPVGQESKVNLVEVREI
ncbi:MAG: pyruvate kinase [Candidatus Magasanikbacteria bacterium]|nr:pyruvate kinase [Candidatus Magasanikbacteria bacterium]